MPHAITESRDVDLSDIRRVRYHAMPILEVEPADPPPRLPTIHRPPRRTLEPARIDQIRIPRIHRHVIYPMAATQYVLPLLPAVRRQIDSSIRRNLATPPGDVSFPYRKVQPRR